MHSIKAFLSLSILCLSPIVLSSCASTSSGGDGDRMAAAPQDYADRLPSHMNTGGQKTVLINPRVHAWGAYASDGSLVKAGLATAGASWCPDIGRPCRTGVGTYHVNSLGSPSCKSTKFPVGRGGAPMPYCMFFNRNIAMHGSPSGEVVEGNISHGCVRMHVGDAEWLRYNFVNVGTKVVVTPY